MISSTGWVSGRVVARLVAATGGVGWWEGGFDPVPHVVVGVAEGVVAFLFIGEINAVAVFPFVVLVCEAWKTGVSVL